MTTLDDHELLKDYARTGSESAFAALVSRHVNLVYSAALRFTANRDHAEEITQAVFIILARKAGTLRRGTVVSGWLYQAARLTAANFVKGEIRRQRREQEVCLQSTLTDPEMAWERIAPLLDEAMGRLGETDRNAVVLRFFENKSAREVGMTLKMNEAAAHKRVSRAVEKLRKIFLRRGVTLPAVAIGGAMTANTMQAASAGLPAAITAATAKGVIVAGSTLTAVHGTLRLMAWTKAKVAMVAGVCVLLAGGTTTFLFSRHLEARQYAVMREPWAEVGAATPKAALESLAWALTHDQFNRAGQLMRWDESGVSSLPGGAKTMQDLTLKATLAPHLKEIESVQILSIEKTLRPDEVIVRVQKTFRNHAFYPFSVRIKLRRSNGEWGAVARIKYFEDGNISMTLPFTGSF